jgi:hypothetical protein
VGRSRPEKVEIRVDDVLWAENDGIAVLNDPSLVAITC